MTADSASGQAELLMMDSGPERTFRVRRPALGGADTADGVTGSMLTGPWLIGPAGIVPAGVLGVLIDNVSAYALVLGRPPGGWSVSAEISLDIALYTQHNRWVRLPPEIAAARAPG
ncbi:MAG: hypothetical protein ACRDN0_35050, partial [Trebonia sp.]